MICTAIVKCERIVSGHEHYYDNAQNGVCPICASLQTQDMDFEEYGVTVDESGATVGLGFKGEGENLFTVGWLVCVKGHAKGRSYDLHMGYNFVGGFTDDIHISWLNDPFFSPEKLFSIVYDPKGNHFYIVSDSGKAYVNGEHLKEERTISDGDRISIGESEYIFIPFCKEGRIWQ